MAAQRLWGRVNRLGFRLFLVVALAIVGIAMAYDFFRLHQERQRALAQLEREARLVARAVEGPLQVWMRTSYPDELEDPLKDIAEAKGAICVGVYDLGGRLLDAVSNAGPAAARSAEGCSEALPAEAVAETVRSYWNLEGTLRILAPLTREGVRAGTLELVLPSTAITDPIQRRRNALLIERGLVLAAVGLSLWLAIAAFVNRPIRHLMRGADEIGRGNLDARIDARSRTEIGDLARAFNRMADGLREAQAQHRAEEERRVALERRVRHVEKLATIGQLATELAHEVGSPLNVISGRARILRREFADGDPRTENLDIIRNQVDRISRVIGRLLKIARPPRMQRERIDLRPIIQEVADFVAPELQKRQVRLDLALAPDLPPVAADSDGLFQVLLNLIMNAIAAVSVGGRIEVTAVPLPNPAGDGSRADPTSERTKAGGIEIGVCDDGHGIDPEILPRVFEPFFSTKRGEGTGLGLSICRDIVKDQGGRITAESRPGAGTTIRIWLPGAPQEAVDEPTSHPHR